VGIVAGLVAIYAGLGYPMVATQSDVQSVEHRVTDEVKGVEVRVDTLEDEQARDERVLRCLLRADPREGPAIDQCPGDPLEGQ